VQGNPVDIDLEVVFFGQNAVKQAAKPGAGFFGEVAVAKQLEALVDHHAEEKEELVNPEIVHFIPMLVENIQESIYPLDLSR
jgi:hypothetical protein